VDSIAEAIAELLEKVQTTWAEWSPQLGPLTVHEDGQPG
jgi:hypothetical protein